MNIKVDAICKIMKNSCGKDVLHTDALSSPLACPLRSVLIMKSLSHFNLISF
jgi:hypothetical protein